MVDMKVWPMYSNSTIVEWVGMAWEVGKMKGQNGRREEGWSLPFKLLKNHFMKKKVFLVPFIFINLSCESSEEA